MDPFFVCNVFRLLRLYGLPTQMEQPIFLKREAKSVNCEAKAYPGPKVQVHLPSVSSLILTPYQGNTGTRINPPSSFSPSTF